MFKSVILNLRLCREMLVPMVIVVFTVVSIAQKLQAELVIPNVRQEPVDSVSVAKVRHLSLQTNHRGQCPLIRIFPHFFIRPKDDTTEYSVYALHFTIRVVMLPGRK
jgi:hypothetical protein